MYKYSLVWVGKNTPILDIAFGFPLFMQLPSVYTGITSGICIQFSTPIMKRFEFEKIEFDKLKYFFIDLFLHCMWVNP